MIVEPDEVVTALFTVYYDPFPTCNLGRTYFEFRKSCRYSLASAAVVFKKWYWTLLYKSRTDSFRLYTSGALDAYRVDVDFFKGSKRLNYCGVLYEFINSDDIFDMKNFLSHPTVYEQLSLFDGYWGF